MEIYEWKKASEKLEDITKKLELILLEIKIEKNPYRIIDLEVE